MRLPAEALHGLRGAVLGAPDGEQRLRDAGFVAGLAVFDDFAEITRTSEHGEPESLPLARFADALAAYLAASGWGSATIDASDPAIVRVRAADWVEGEPDAAADFPACHFSTGLLAALFGRVAGAPLAVLETRCRSTGADACEFAVGGREVMEALWESLAS